MGFCVRVEITNFVSPQDFQIFYLLFIEHLPLPLPLEDIVLSLPGQYIMSDNESLSLSTPRRSPRHLQHDKHQASSSPSADVSPPHPPSPSAPSTNNDIIERVRSVDEIIADTHLHLEREIFFDLLQDGGIEMTDVEAMSYKSTLAKPKRKSKKIAFGTRFFSDLYTLSSRVWDIISQFRHEFPRLPKGGTNKSAYLHDIGKIIAMERKAFSMADVHGIGNDGCESISDLVAKHEDKETIFVLSQKMLLNSLYSKYGPVPASKKPTNDDKVRVMGLLFNNPNLREYLPDMLGKTRGGSRANLDAAPARKRAGFRGLFIDFIDPEIVVTIPEQWFQDSTKEKVDSSKGAGTFDEFGHINPNNIDRIRLPWTEKEVSSIFNSVMLEYNPAMHNWMKGTGGGSGAPEDFSIWQNRDPIHFIDYSNQPARIYLSLVYMWDKKYNFILVTQKDTMPEYAAIDDVMFGSTSFGDDSELNEDNGDGRSAKSVRRSTSMRKEDNLVSVLKSMKEARDDDRLTSTKLLDALHGMASPKARSNSFDNDKNDSTHTIMSQMKETSEYINMSENTLRSLLRKRKKKVQSHAGQKIIRRINKEIKSERETIKTLQAVKENHRLKLSSMASVEKKKLKALMGDNDDDNNDDDDDDDEDDDDVDDDNDGIDNNDDDNDDDENKDDEGDK